MQSQTADRLNAINYEFYQTFAAAFAETRQRVQPGVSRVLKSIAPHESVLDLGCGGGAVADQLFEMGHRGRYVGLDASESLLQRAQNGLRHPDAHFVLADLTRLEWSRALVGRFDHVFAFAVLHHIPGEEWRLRLARNIRQHAMPNGLVSLSTWNFLAAERLRERILLWEDVGLSEAEVDPGDYLLDWRRGGYGLRYVHHFSDMELSELARQAGFQVIERFLSDGEGCVLGRYQRWQIAGA
jgi:tRNA (uracil-5-)-methyltransferase TRM9